MEISRVPCKYLFNISDTKINELRYRQVTPVIEFGNNLKVEKYYYLDEFRAMILFLINNIKI